MQALAISMATSTCVFLGEVAQRMVVSPDIWQLLSNVSTPNVSLRSVPSHTQQPADLVAAYLPCLDFRHLYVLFEAGMRHTMFFVSLVRYRIPHPSGPESSRQMVCLGHHTQTETYT